MYLQTFYQVHSGLKKTKQTKDLLCQSLLTVVLHWLYRNFNLWSLDYRTSTHTVIHMSQVQIPFRLNFLYVKQFINTYSVSLFDYLTMDLEYAGLVGMIEWVTQPKEGSLNFSKLKLLFTWTVYINCLHELFSCWSFRCPSGRTLRCYPVHIRISLTR